MNIRELIDALEGIASRVGDDAEVRLATQPSYPFQNRLGEPAEAYLTDPRTDEERPVVYLPDGGQVYSDPYLPGAAAEALGWR